VDTANPITGRGSPHTTADAGAAVARGDGTWSAYTYSLLRPLDPTILMACINQLRSARIALSTVASVAVLASAGCVLARPARATVGPPPQSLAARDVIIPSTSGSELHAWLIRGRQGAGAVVLLHGVGDNRTSMLGRARFLQAAGYTVLAPDFQAHGESPGEHITFGARESLDAAAAVSFLRAEAPTERVGVIGVSMGGAAALVGPAPLRVDALVLESVYPTIRDAISNRLKVWLGPFGFLGPVLAPVLLDAVGPQIGVSESELRPITRIGDTDTPLLVVAGSNDPYTPIEEARDLFGHARSPKAFWQVSGAGHEDLHAFAPAEYERIVGSFLAANLRPGAQRSR